MNYNWSVAFITLVTVLLVAAPGFAESPIDKQAAMDQPFDELISEAQQAFENGDYEAAVEYLIVAKAQKPEPALLLNIARSYEMLGDCRRQLAYYQTFLDDPPGNDNLISRAESALQQASGDCDDYNDELSGRLSFDTSPPLATVYINGESYGATPTEAAGLSPGTHTLRFSMDGYQDHIARLQIEPGDSNIHIDAELQPLPDDTAEPVADLDQPPTVDPAEPTDFELEPIAVGLIGGGLVALSYGAIVDLWVLPQLTQIRDDATDAGEHDRASDMTQLRADIAVTSAAGFIIGGLLTAGGLAWIGYDYYHYDQQRQQQAHWQLTPRVDTDGAGLFLSGQF